MSEKKELIGLGDSSCSQMITRVSSRNVPMAMTKERQPCWCLQLILRESNYILIQTCSLNFFGLKNMVINHVSENTLKFGFDQILIF